LTGLVFVFHRGLLDSCQILLVFPISGQGQEFTIAHFAALSSAIHCILRFVIGEDIDFVQDRAIFINRADNIVGVFTVLASSIGKLTELVQALLASLLAAEIAM